MHINCLELLAAHLAIKCYAKNKTNLTIIMKMDSMSALTYINEGERYPPGSINQPKTCGYGAWGGISSSKYSTYQVYTTPQRTTG